MALDSQTVAPPWVRRKCRPSVAPGAELYNLRSSSETRTAVRTSKDKKRAVEPTEKRSEAQDILNSLQCLFFAAATRSLVNTEVNLAELMYMGIEQTEHHAVSLLALRPRLTSTNKLIAAFLCGEKLLVESLAGELDLHSKAGLLVVPVSEKRVYMKAIGCATASWGKGWQEIGLDTEHTVSFPVYMIWPQAPPVDTITLKLYKVFC